MYDVSITYHNEEKDKVYQEEKQVRHMTELARVVMTLKPRKGYRVVHINVQEFEGLV